MRILLLLILSAVSTLAIAAPQTVVCGQSMECSVQGKCKMNWGGGPYVDPNTIFSDAPRAAGGSNGTFAAASYGNQSFAFCTYRLDPVYGGGLASFVAVPGVIGKTLGTHWTKQGECDGISVNCPMQTN